MDSISILLAQIIRVTEYNCLCYNSVWLCLLPCVALDARLEVGLEQQAELMLKMMSTLEADSILQALTNTSPTCNYILSNCSLHIMTIWKLCSFFLQLHGSLEEVEFCFNDIVRLCFRDSIQIFKLCMYTFKTFFEVAQIGRIPITVHNNTVQNNTFSFVRLNYYIQCEILAVWKLLCTCFICAVIKVKILNSS